MDTTRRSKWHISPVLFVQHTVYSPMVWPQNSRAEGHRFDPLSFQPFFSFLLHTRAFELALRSAQSFGIVHWSRGMDFPKDDVTESGDTRASSVLCVSGSCAFSAPTANSPAQGFRGPVQTTPWLFCKDSNIYSKHVCISLKP